MAPKPNNKKVKKKKTKKKKAEEPVVDRVPEAPAASHAAAEATKPAASRCFPAWLFLMILPFMAMAEYLMHACMLLLTQIAVPSPMTWAFNCRFAEIKAPTSVGARKKKAKKKDGKKKDVNKTPKKKAKKNNGQARHEVALKPLEAEPLLKALKTEWDKMRKEKKTEVHACEILAKVVACCHVSHPPHQEKGIQNAGQDHRVSSHYST
jgi:hypothetical protein